LVHNIETRLITKVVCIIVLTLGEWLLHFTCSDWCTAKILLYPCSPKSNQFFLLQRHTPQKFT